MIEKGKKVRLDYSLIVEGQEIDSSLGKFPVEYTHGDGGILPGLEERLEGLKQGDEKKIILKPENAYGHSDPNAIKEVSKAVLLKDAEIKVGSRVKLKSHEGKTVEGSILEIKNGDKVLVDFNHPFAGKILQFDIKILQVQ
jgi:FKBP-type peptidyl-prolyl cis-trans isomerase 2